MKTQARCINPTCGESNFIVMSEIVALIFDDKQTARKVSGYSVMCANCGTDLCVAGGRVWRFPLRRPSTQILQAKPRAEEETEPVPPFADLRDLSA